MRRLAVLAVALSAACTGGPSLVLAPMTTVPERHVEPVLALDDSPAPMKAPPEEDAPVPIMRDDPARGSRFAAVTIVEFADYQCPYCQRVEATLAALRDHYGDEGLRIVWKNNPLPFHPRARPAAEASAGVFALGGNEAFWLFHDSAFAHPQALDASSFEDWARAAGVNVDTFREGEGQHAWAAKIDDDLKLAERLHVAGTPHFFVNGVRLSGAQPVDKFEALVDEETKKANAKMADGASRARIYVTMARVNYDGMRENVVDW